MSSTLDVGTLVGTVALDAVQFDRTYVRVVRQMSDLGATAERSAAGTSKLDGALAGAGASASKAATGLGRADEALAGAGVSASDAAAATRTLAVSLDGASVATSKTALASSRLTQAQLRQLAALQRVNDVRSAAALTADRLTSAEAKLAELQTKEGVSADKIAAAQSRVDTLRVASAAAIGRQVSADAALIAANDRVALSQERVATSGRLTSTTFHGLFGEATGLTDAFEKIPTPITVAAGALAKVGEVAGVTGVAVAALSIDIAQKFQSAMTRLHTQANVSTHDVGVLSKGVLAMSGTVATTPQILAAAAYHIASVGQKSLTTAQQLQILKISAEGAKLGGADLVDVTNALDAAVVSGIHGVNNYSQAMGVLNATVGAGDMSMQDLADAFGPLGAVLKGYNVTIQQAGAALAVFGDNNVRGAQAGTYLRMAVQALAVPVANGAAMLEQWGIKAGNLSQQLQHGGLTEALDTLMRKMRENGVTAKEQGDVLTQAFGKRAGVGLNVLMGELDRFHNKLDEVGRGGNTFSSSWAAYTRTFEFNLHSAEAAAESLGVQLGDKLLPDATKVLHWLATSGVHDLDEFGHWFTAHQGTIAHFAGAFVEQFDLMAKIALDSAGVIIDSMAHAFGWIPHFGGEIKGAARDFDSFKNETLHTMDSLVSSLMSVKNKMGSVGRNIGADFGTGLIIGLDSKDGQVRAHAQILAAQITKNARLAIESNSPSRAAIRIGEDFDAGLVIGLQQGQAAVAAAAATVSHTIAAAVAPTVTDPSQLAAIFSARQSGAIGRQASANAAHASYLALHDQARALDETAKAATKAATAAKRHADAMKSDTAAEKAAKTAAEDQAKAAEKAAKTAQRAADAADKAASKGKTAWSNLAQGAQNAASTAADAASQLVSSLSDALSQMQSDIAGFEATVQQGVVGDDSLSSIWQSLVGTDDAGNPVNPTLDQVQGALNGVLASAQQFSADLNTLVGEGASQDLVTQLLGMGPGAGDALAQELLAAGPTVITAFSQLYASIDTVATNEGQTLAKGFYGAGVDSITKFIDGLERQFPALAKALEGLKGQIGSIWGTVVLPVSYMLPDGSVSATTPGKTAKPTSTAKAPAKSSKPTSTWIGFGGGWPHFASGVTNFAGGLAVVGEYGPELVSLPAGSSVHPHESGGASVTAMLHPDDRALLRQVVTELDARPVQLLIDSGGKRVIGEVSNEHRRERRLHGDPAYR